MRTSEPGYCACCEDDHWCPFEEKRCHVLASRFSSDVDVVDAGWPVGDAEGAEYNWDPKVPDRSFGFYEVGKGGEN